MRHTFPGREAPASRPERGSSASGSKPEDIQEIEGHLKGGIPARDIDALADFWQVLPSLREALFEPNRRGHVSPRLQAGEVPAAISAHAEFAAFRDTVNAGFEQSRQANRPRLTGFDQGQQPKALIETVSEDLLETFWTAPRLDAYDIYQRLMDYWWETIQDDCYVIAADSWKAETRRVREDVKSDIKKGQMRDEGWACDLIPKPILVARYFAEDQATIDASEAELERVDAELEALKDEHDSEDGPLEDASLQQGRGHHRLRRGPAGSLERARPRSLRALHRAVGDRRDSSGGPGSAARGEGMRCVSTDGDGRWQNPHKWTILAWCSYLAGFVTVETLLERTDLYALIRAAGQVEDMLGVQTHMSLGPTGRRASVTETRLLPVQQEMESE